MKDARGVRERSWLRHTALIATIAILSALAGSQAGASTYFLSVDVPSTLGGTAFTPSQLVRNDGAAYSLAAALPVGAEVSALHRKSDGVWLIVPAHPLNLGGILAEPRDVVSFDGVTFAIALNGKSAGIPDGARIDSLFMIGGDLSMSFDVPVNLGGTEYSRSDLVRHTPAGFSLYWDAESAGVPSAANVVGADRDAAGVLVVSFDVPTSLGGTTFLPGQLVRWTGGTTFSSYALDAGWPPSAQLRDFSFPAPAGVVPDGASGSVPLTVTANAGNLTLSWGSSCASSDTDYEIYEGVVGTYYSHTQKFCTTAGATSKSFRMPSGSTYYLIAPKNAVSEGSYGRSSSGAEIPQGVSACLPQSVAVTCP